MTYWAQAPVATTYTSSAELQASGGNYWEISHDMGRQWPAVSTMFSPQSGGAPYEGNWINAESVLTVLFHDANTIRIYNDSGTAIASENAKVTVTG